MKTDVIEKKDVKVTEDSASQMVYGEYMAEIIKQMPNPGKLRFLQGTSNAQASFYYNDADGKINETLYDKLLSQRIRGRGEKYGVEQVELTQSSFVNDYNSIYLQLRYQLSPADKATAQRLDAETASSVAALRPMWNKWVKATQSKEVPHLDMDDTDMALMQVTATLQTKWINPDYVPKLAADPSYPYMHMNNFDVIFNRIPLSVPQAMREKIKDVYNAQGEAGGLTARRANANQTLKGILHNIKSPSKDNGGCVLAGSERPVPGMKFEPDRAAGIVDELRTSPPSNVFRYSKSITKSNSETLMVNASAGSGISIPILSFLSFNAGGGVRTSIFKEEYAGSEYNVEVVVNNATVSPVMAIQPRLYQVANQLGWMYISPITEALKNGTDTNITGYVFDQKPNFDFSEGGDFGYAKTAVFSQFLELNIRFKQCNSKEVRRYFEQHASFGISFLGISLGGAKESSSYSYSYNEKSESEITVTIKPKPPGYKPGTENISQSLCQLVAIGVEYPVAK